MSARRPDGYDQRYMAAGESLARAKQGMPASYHAVFGIAANGSDREADVRAGRLAMKSPTTQAGFLTAIWMWPGEVFG